jgi:hypothetical protein
MSCQMTGSGELHCAIISRSFPADQSPPSCNHDKSHASGRTLRRQEPRSQNSQEDLITFETMTSGAGQTPNSKTHPCMLALRAIEVVKMGENDNNMGIRITTTEDFPVSALIHHIVILCRSLRLHSNARRSWRLVSTTMTMDFCQMTTLYPLLNIV